MSEPRIECVPLFPAVASDRSTVLDVLVRITPPELERKGERLPLNLALVIDRSGSMAGEKLAFAQQAARHAVGLLEGRDRLSLVVFDDEVETLVVGGTASEQKALLAAIEGIDTRGSTALHAGWHQGSRHVAAGRAPGQLDRVILLSDGQANRGETNPDAIAAHVRRMAVEGVSTTTMGEGLDYNEDLLEAMARAGDGDYHFIESPAQLPDIFAAELHGLMATFGRAVSLGVE
ncbi:MAG: VWA domain-containing protein, partial [Myxococcaceae bacterium]|nr:VWA domain-containing protein [Myxococcaceae bacterium]